MVTQRAPAVVSALQAQLDQPWFSEYLEVARRHGHALTLVQYVDPNGKPNAPKLTIDARGEKRRSG